LQQFDADYTGAFDAELVERISRGPANPAFELVENEGGFLKGLVVEG
jgi:hypothetical protein